jgi:soluble lytic murein transglycosylase-like protein
MLLAGAAFFVPHAGKPPAKVHHSPTPVARFVQTPVGRVTTTADFRLPEEFAFEEFIQEAAARYNIKAAIIRAVIQTESAFNALAVSTAGAQGLMQLMPALAAELGVTNPFDPRENIMAGTRYLSSLLDDHNGNLPLALASYNAGPGNVQRYHGIPPFKETRSYVKKITKLLAEEPSE